MSANHSENTHADESLFGLQRYLIRFVAVVAMLLIVIPLLPGLISNIAYSFSGEAPQIYWYLSRSAGFVAFTILWVSMVLGLGITNKLARLWPGAPAAFAIHEFVSLLGLAFVAYHGLVLMGDHFVDFSLPRLLMPFSIEYETFWVGLGQVGFYVWAIVTATFYVRRLIGQKTWRLIHFVNFATYTMGLLHGIFSGTDSSVSWVRWYYLASTGSLLVLLVYRLREAASKRNFSLATLIKQRAQDLSQAATQAATTLKRRTLSPTEKRILDSLRRSQNLLSASSRDKASAPDSKPDTPLQTIIDEKPGQAVVNEEPQLQTLETPAAAEQSPITVNSSSEVPAIPVSEEKAPSAAPAEKQGQDSGKRKINIRIFKEPPEEQIILKAQRDTSRKQFDMDPLIVKLRKFFRATPIQPAKPAKQQKRVRILED